jgi:hypothetical protein
MGVSKNQYFKRILLPISVFLVVICSVDSARAGGASEQSGTEDNVVVPTEAPEIPTQPTVSSGTNSANGYNNYIYQGSNSNYGNLSTPTTNCDGICPFVIGRMTTSLNGNPNWEAITGVTTQIGSASAKTNRSTARSIQAQTDRANDDHVAKLTGELASAIKQGEQEKSKMLSMLLYKRLGYSNYTSLLQALGVNW